MINKTIEYFKKNFKLLLFILIFCILIFASNQNSQTLNYILKRGVILQYAIPSDAKIEKDKIKEKLKSLNIRYSYIDSIDNYEYDMYDFEQKKS